MNLFAHQQQTQRYYQLPKSSVITNDIELKKLKAKLLRDNYQKQTKQKQAQYNYQSNKLSRNQSMPNINRSISALDNFNQQQYARYQKPTQSKMDAYGIPLNQMKDKQLRRFLAQDLDEQIRNHEINVRKQKQQNLKQIKDNYSRLDMWMKETFNREKQTKKQIQQQLKKDYLESVKRKQLVKDKMRREKQEEGWRINHYQNLTQQNIMRRNSLGYMPNPQVQNHNEKYHSKRIKPAQTSEYITEERLNSIRQRTIQQQSLKKELMHALQQQIDQKSKKKRQEKLKQHWQEYTDESLRKKHNPIINPIDFKFPNDNNYVIKELLKAQYSPSPYK